MVGQTIQYRRLDEPQCNSKHFQELERNRKLSAQILNGVMRKIKQDTSSTLDA